MSHKYAKVAMVLAIIVVLALAATGGAIAQKGGTPGPPPDKGGGGGGGEETAGNNLSFPAIAADGATITDVVEEFSVPYLNADGSYFTIPGEVPEFPWYAQKVEDNTWNAEFYNASSTEVVTVLGVDWGDLIESVSPTVGRPYRLETALFVDRTLAPMKGYVMGMIANPSSPDEIQGTNKTQYDSHYATIYSAEPSLRIQDITGIDAANLSWDATSNYWVTPTGTPAATPISFAPELNVGGKYIFGASTGGWKPTDLGTFRITFYIPDTSNIMMLESTTLGNLVGDTWVDGAAGEGGAVPQVVWDKNLSYVDVQVITKGGGGGKPQ